MDSPTLTPLSSRTNTTTKPSRPEKPSSSHPPRSSASTSTATPIWPSIFAAERTSFQNDLRTIIELLRSRDNHGLHIKFAHQISKRTTYPGDMNYLINAVKGSSAPAEHIARRHLLANIKSMTSLFLEHRRERQSPCFVPRLTRILEYCRNLERRLRENVEMGMGGSRTAREVANALELVILQVGTVTLDGDLEADRQAWLAWKRAGRKTGEFRSMVQVQVQTQKEKEKQQLSRELHGQQQQQQEEEEEQEEKQVMDGADFYSSLYVSSRDEESLIDGPFDEIVGRRATCLGNSVPCTIDGWNDV
ncbi:hypothetical protein POX_a01261 [Penicillium oxalicum]|uniref:hypothetical protein n=1 Tax=Penicillium oxalicum TaxID=69781 RepID=UPI0020B67D82|nr:hypothetical protein POX_a01261 [Penicillium oxalicum]KAI2794662.1 hypothetical protein POX_a01261 [Penicillium oxalicum]